MLRSRLSGDRAKGPGEWHVDRRAFSLRELLTEQELKSVYQRSARRVRECDTVFSAGERLHSQAREEKCQMKGEDGELSG